MGRRCSAFHVQGAIQVRIKNAAALALVMMLIGTSASIAQPEPADDAPLQGNWKLIVADREFAILKVIERGGKTTAAVLDTAQMLEKNTVKNVERKHGTMTLTLTGPNAETTFKGRLAKDGRDAGKFLGTVKFRGPLLQARLERTEQSKVAKPPAERSGFKIQGNTKGK
jgi:hypothetical protein